MTTGRHLVHATIADEYTGGSPRRRTQLPVGDPFRDQVALGPLIDAGQRDRVHGWSRRASSRGATLPPAALEGLFYRPTVLADVAVDAPAYPRRSSVRSPR